MIRQLGTHLQKTIAFGFDRYVLPELDAYTEILSRYGNVANVATEHLHDLTSAQTLCEMVQSEPDHMGVLICGTGMGMSIAANKFRGIYAVRCLEPDDGHMARTINNANVLCLAAKTGLEINEQIIAGFMETAYEGRKLDQLEAITEMELEANPAPRVPRLSIATEARRSA